MKNIFLFAISVAFLFLAVGCSNVEKVPPEGIPDSVVEEQISAQSIPTLITLSVTDLNAVFDTLDLTNATLACHSAQREAYPANAAICCENYIEKLKSFTWQEHVLVSEWEDTEDYFYIYSEEHTWSDGHTSLVRYNIYLFDTQTQVLYYFHHNI